MRPAQLPLALAFPRASDFESFRAGENAAALDAVRAFARRPEGVLLLLGPSGSGKSHLLAAACRAHADAGGVFRYLQAGRWPEDRASELAALSGVSLLAIDALEKLAGCRALEEALFALFNAVRDRGGGVLAASREHPEALQALLPDLRSRLLAGLRFRLQPLPEEERREVLRARARAMGIALEEPVLDYLFRRHSRDLKSLIALLERLERESLSRQRAVTVPLLREVLGTSDQS